MSFIVKDANQRQLDKWDSFIDTSINGTLFHKRKFLSYHGERFLNSERFLVITKGDEVACQIPIAIQKSEDKLFASSPYGASYGGIIFKKNPSYSRAKKISQSFVRWMTAEGITKCTMTQPIDICSSYLLDTFKFSLMEVGFQSKERNISSIFRIKTLDTINQRITSKTRNVIKMSRKKGVLVRNDANINDFWKLMELTYSRHKADPTHTYEELNSLMSIFPNQIKVHTAEYKGNTIAGICEFAINTRVKSAFYLCRNSEFDSLQGLSLIVFDALERAKKENYKYYDFGTSTVGMKARPNIFKFKEGFGTEGIFRESWEWINPKIKDNSKE